MESGYLMHGGDYNPEQWLDMPEVLETDIVRFREAKINTVTVGIFSWAKLEPEEGEYRFKWLEEIIDRLHGNGISVILATPSGARPHWLADKYPEVLRVNAMRQRNLFGGRHNHCLSSPVYREKVRQINGELVKRLGGHPAVKMWHISNELGGECHCELCQKAFRGWLKKKYQTIDALNKSWWTTFWSHTYDSFDQIESPSPLGEMSVTGLKLDWRRFISDQTIDYMEDEIRAIREAGSDLPVTTNMMYHFYDIDYFRLAEKIDIASWDNYPSWHKHNEWETARDTAFWHDVIRSLKRKPFFLMESCPGATNWKDVSKLKRPGMLTATSLQSIAHGSDGAMYFQMRKGRGAAEKLHGAVLDHYDGNDTRTFRDALDGSEGPRNKDLHYQECVEKSYRALRRQGLNVDVIDQKCSFAPYRFVAAPMQYLFHEGFAEKIREFVEKGGTFVLTYWSGVVDENDLCFLGGTPHGLMDVFGLRSEEIDSLYDEEENLLCRAEAAPKELGDGYVCKYLCQLVKPTTAKTLMVYGKDFYAGTPALLENDFGEGKAYYVCADAEQAFYDDLYEKLAKEAGVSPILPTEIPDGVEVTGRSGENVEYIFFQNFNRSDVKVNLPKGEVIFGDKEGNMKPLGNIVVKVSR